MTDENAMRALVQHLLTSGEDEHRRIARELHDDISQRLAMIEMDTEEVERVLASDPAQAREKLQSIQNLLAGLAEDVRAMSHSFYPSLIEDLGLVPALRSLVEDADGMGDTTAAFSAGSVPESIPVEVSIALYRIMQEALRSLQHAGPAEITVNLQGTETGVQLEIADPCAGFDTRLRRHWLGLTSMAERARIIGATVHLSSTPGRGTKVLVDVPLPRKE